MVYIFFVVHMIVAVQQTEWCVLCCDNTIMMIFCPFSSVCKMLVHRTRFAVEVRGGREKKSTHTSINKTTNK